MVKDERTKAYAEFYSAPCSCKVWSKHEKKFLTRKSSTTGKLTEWWETQELHELWEKDGKGYFDYLYCYDIGISYEKRDGSLGSLCAGDIVRDENGNLWTVSYGVSGYQLISGSESSDDGLKFRNADDLEEEEHFTYIGHALTHPEMLEEE